jgi:hypothetical protein
MPTYSRSLSIDILTTTSTGPARAVCVACITNLMKPIDCLLAHLALARLPSRPLTFSALSSVRRDPKSMRLAGTVLATIALLAVVTAAASASAATSEQRVTVPLQYKASHVSSTKARAMTPVRRLTDAHSHPTRPMPVHFVVAAPGQAARIESLVMSVSDPSSASYGRWADAATVAGVMAAPAASVAAITEWLHATGCVAPRPGLVGTSTTAADFRVRTWGTTVTGWASPSCWERVFATELHEFEHVTAARTKGHAPRRQRLRLAHGMAPTVPAHVRPHIHVVVGLDNIPRIRLRAHTRARTRTDPLALTPFRLPRGCAVQWSVTAVRRARG